MAVRNWKGPQLELALYTVSRFLDSTYYTRPLCPTLRFPAPSVVPLVSPDPNLHPLRHELLLCPRAHLHAPAGPSSRPRLAGPSYIPSEGRLPRHPLHFSSQRDTERESRFGLAVKLVSGRTSVRYRFGSPFCCCGLWTLSYDFVNYFHLKH